ncbi:MAG: PAS domain-containing protein [Acidobacteriia bacterium]|nr:PAS domain-containing protein [Terriglobia bacterium]
MSDAGLSEAFLSQSPACYWIVDTDQAFRHIYGDTSSLLGKSAAELAGRPVAEALEPELAKAWRDRFARAFGGETLTLRERRGNVIWNISVFPIRLEGETRFAGVAGRETTSWSKAEQELRHTVLGALKAQEFERNMVSRFLHDSVGQNLTALGLQLDLIRMDLESVSPETCGRIAEIQKLLEEMMEEVREYSYELNPSTVERAGLRSALDRLAARIRERFTGSLRLNVDPSLKLDKKIAAALYQIAQEAVENAVQHSSCSAIEIAVKSSRTGTFLEVRDNGKGFDPADLLGGGRGLGLLSMEHYAAQAGLDLAITSTRETGTTVRAAALGI